MAKIFFLLIAAAAVLPVTGCATMFYGSTQHLTFESIPPDATVILKHVPFTEEFRYQTPVSLEVPRSMATLVMFQKDGYRPKQIDITRDMNVLALCGNIITLGTTLQIDFVTGAAWTINPDRITVELEPDTVDPASVK